MSLETETGIYIIAPHFSFAQLYARIYKIKPGSLHYISNPSKLEGVERGVEVLIISGDNYGDFSFSDSTWNVIYAARERENAGMIKLKRVRL